MLKDTEQSRRLGFSDSQFVTGIDQVMDSSTTFSAVLFDQSTLKLYHVLIDVTGTASVTATLLYENINFARETFFTPARSSETVNGASV